MKHSPFPLNRSFFDFSVFPLFFWLPQIPPSPPISRFFLRSLAEAPPYFPPFVSALLFFPFLPAEASSPIVSLPTQLPIPALSIFPAYPPLTQPPASLLFFSILFFPVAPQLSSAVSLPSSVFFFKPRRCPFCSLFLFVPFFLLDFPSVKFIPVAALWLSFFLQPLMHLPSILTSR